MIDRRKYTWKYAPPADELVAAWMQTPPSSRDIESFFSKELCEASEHEYFLCVADLFLDVVKKQELFERLESLAILSSRLVDAAEFARGVSDGQLKQHFDVAIATSQKCIMTAPSGQAPLANEITKSVLGILP